MSIEEAIRQAVREEVRTAVREELRGLAPPRGAPSAPEWLTAAEAALAARCRPATIREWIRRGRLKASGRPYRIRRADLEVAIAAKVAPPADEVDIEREAAKIVALDRRRQG